mgnify:CR=1 FL=1
MNHQGILVVVSGFSGAGKGTLMKELLKRYDNYALSISATTRAPREGETDGKEYFFVTKEQFEKVAATGMSDAQLYKQAGNSITVAVVEAIAKNLLKFDEEINNGKQDENF